MSKCYYCNVEIRNLPYRCKFCGMIFCKIHRLPENHDCPFDLINKLQLDDHSKYNLKYQDALDFINKDLDVAKIYDYFSTKKFTKKESIDLLKFFIETSDQIEVRKNSILAFELLDFKTEDVFQILQNCLLSDETPIIRNIAAKVLRNKFPKKSKTLLNWAYKHDKGLKV